MDKSGIHCHNRASYASFMVAIFQFILAISSLWIIQSLLLGSLENERAKEQKLLEQEKAISRLYPNSKPLPY